MRKIIKSLLLSIGSILIFIFLFFTTSSVVEHIQKTMKVEEFKSKGVYQESMSTDKVRFYKIEANEKVRAYTKSGENIIPGGPADICTTINTKLPFFNAFVGFYIGGHAALSLDNYADHNVNVTPLNDFEATGMVEESTKSTIYDRSYFGTTFYNEVIVLRAPINEQQRKEVVGIGLSLLDDDYNYSFCFNTTNTSYCSDIMSKTYDHVGINLNKDGLTTSIWDIIVSDDVYISYYHYYDDKGVKHIYYLDWEE